MPKRKPPSDPNQAAKSILGQLTGEETAIREPDAAAAALGRKGGEARSKALSPDEKRRIAREAARKRWGTK